MSNESRRALRFEALDDVVRDVETLHREGWRRAGRWDLAQACGHLADWMTFPVEGFPRTPLLLRPLLFVLRRTVAPRGLRRALTTGETSAGAPTIASTVPAPGGDEAEAVARLRRAVERFQTHEGPFHPSPLFGRLDRETWTRLQLVHCAHHLSRLAPNASS